MTWIAWWKRRGERGSCQGLLVKGDEGIAGPDRSVKMVMQVWMANDGATGIAR